MAVSGGGGGGRLHGEGRAPEQREHFNPYAQIAETMFCTASWWPRGLATYARAFATALPPPLPMPLAVPITATSLGPTALWGAS